MWIALLAILAVAGLALIAIQYGKAVDDVEHHEQEANTRSRARYIRDKLARLRKGRKG